MFTQARPGGHALIARRSIRSASLLALGAVALAGPAHAASGSSSTDTGASTAQVVAPISVSHLAGATLAFGKFTTGTGGTIVVDAAGAGTTTADVGFVPGSLTTADAFSVTGEANASFSITTTGGTVTAGATSMAFTTAPSLSTAALSIGGTGAFSVGGTLTVAGTEPAGSYIGSYDVTVAYN